MQETWAIHGVYPDMGWMPDGIARDLGGGPDPAPEAGVEPPGGRREGRSYRVEVIPFRVHDSRPVTEALRYPVEVAPKFFPLRMIRSAQTSPTATRSSSRRWAALGPQPAGRRAGDAHAQRDHFEFFPLLA